MFRCSACQRDLQGQPACIVNQAVLSRGRTTGYDRICRDCYYVMTKAAALQLSAQEMFGDIVGIVIEDE